LHTIWGTYSVRYKSVFALNIYKWMSFILLGALGLTAFTSWTYANTQFAWMQNADGTSGASDEGELKNVKKLRSQFFDTTFTILVVIIVLLFFDSFISLLMSSL